VVNGGPDDGQTQSDVHSSVEAKKLQGCRAEGDLERLSPLR
jgi:hypothetical protein